MVRMDAFAHIKVDVPNETIAELWNQRASRFADKTYLHFHERAWSYAEMNHTAEKAAGLLKSLGAEKGEHVAVLLPN
jgi:non-ribosomal peptide synthetase component E (peptide arylation enzyme)